MMRLNPEKIIRYKFDSPDYIEMRGELTLLVWGDIPYWTAMDKELYVLLNELDGKKSLDEVIAQKASWEKEKKSIVKQLGLLRQAGVLGEGDAPLESRLKEAEPARIENIALNITLRCNLRCQICYGLPYLSRDASDELSAEEIISFLEMVRPFLGDQPSFTPLGGEPLLATAKLLATNEYAKQHGFTTLVSTNGTLITDDFARCAKKIGLQVQVSLDGPNAELNDRVRGYGAFDSAVKGIQALVRNRVHTIISLVFHKDNAPYLEAFYDLARSLGANEARFIPLKRLGGGAKGAFVPVPLDEMLLSAFELFKRRRDLLKMLGRDAFSILANTCRYSVRRPSCGTGLQTLLLDAEGGLYPCLNARLPEFRIANLRDPGFDFARLWQESAVLLRVRQQTALAREDTEHSSCPVRFWCLGGCRGENYQLTGGLGRRPPNCAELKRGIIEMFWMLTEAPELVKPAIKTC